MQIIDKFKKADRQTQILIIAGIVIFLLIVTGFIIIYFYGKNKGKQEGSVNVSTTPTDDPSGNNTAAASTAEIETISSELYQDMKGSNALGHNLDPWKRFLALSDTDFVKVYNEFNMSYQTDSEETMRSWVENESSTTLFAIQGWKDIRSVVITRMDKLNLK